MARWVWPAAAGVVTSATGVAINLATDGGGNPWAWTTVGLLTALGVVIALRVQPAPPAVAPEPQPPTSTSTSTVHNSVSGTVTGGVVQGSEFGSVTVNSPTTIDQNATAHGGSTIYQAGRDVRRNP